MSMELNGMSFPQKDFTISHDVADEIVTDVTDFTTSTDIDDHILPDMYANIKSRALSLIKDDDVRLAVEANLCMNCQWSVGCKYDTCLLARTSKLYNHPIQKPTASEVEQCRKLPELTVTIIVDVRDGVVQNMCLKSVSPKPSEANNAQ